MKDSVWSRIIRSCRLGLKLLVLGNPANLFALQRTARLRKASPEALISQYAAQTSSQFKAAQKQGDAICVVIPCRNEGAHLPSTLVALARNGNVLPIVVDNNSTDNTSAVAKQMGAIVISEPKGNKMAGTQAGIRYAREKLGAQRVLFIDGDTMPLANWAKTMDKLLRRLDVGNGAAVFGSVVNMFGPSHIANFASTMLGFTYTILRELRGEDPIARGGNYGLSFDASGAMEKHIYALKKDSFYAGVPDDAQTLRVLQDAKAAIIPAYSAHTWAITDNDRLISLRDIKTVVQRGVTYADVTNKYYADQYGKAKKAEPKSK